MLDAGLEVLIGSGFEGLSLQAVAERAGVNRVTVWRQVRSRENLVDLLLGRLAGDYRDVLWSVMTSTGNGATRLRFALEALCDVADRHLGLLAAAEPVFHRARHGQAMTEAVTRLVADGIADSSLRPSDGPETTGFTLFNAVFWPYVHLRARYGWGHAAAQGSLVRLVFDGLGPKAPRPSRQATSGQRRASTSS